MASQLRALRRAMSKGQMFRALLDKQKELDNANLVVEIMLTIAKEREISLSYDDMKDVCQHPQDHLENIAEFMREKKAKEEADAAEQKKADDAFNEATSQQTTPSSDAGGHEAPPPADSDQPGVEDQSVPSASEDDEILDNVVTGVFGGPAGAVETTLEGDPV
jgi:hypothetical protein